MNNPEQIIDKINLLTHDLKFNFRENLESIQIQYQKLDHINNELTDIDSNLSSSIDSVQSIIDKINKKLAISATVGIAVSLMSNNNEEEDSNWVEELCNSMLSDFGDNLLDNSINDYIRHNVQDRDGLHNFYNNLVSIKKYIEIKINQVNNLKSVAHLCINEQEINIILNQNISGITFNKHKLIFNNFFFNSQFKFLFNDMKSINSFFLDLKTNFIEMNYLQKDVENFSDVMKMYTDNSSDISNKVISTMINFFGDSLELLKYDGEGNLIWVTLSASYLPNNLLSISNNLNEYYKNSISATKELYNLVESCVNDNAFIELINNSPKPRNLYFYDEDINNKISQVLPILPILSKDKLLERIEIFKNLHKDLKVSNLNFKIIHHNSLQKSYFHLNYNSIIALISLFGGALKTIGFNEEGNPCLTIKHDTYTIQEFLDEVSTINNTLKNYIPRINCLLVIGKQIVSSTKLGNSIHNKNELVPINAFFLTFNEQLNNLSMEFDIKNRGVLEVQVKRFQPIFDKSQNIASHMKQIVSYQDELNFSASILEKYIFLFGKIDSVGFNEKGKLYLVQDNKKYTVNEIQKRCNSWLPKLTKKLKKVDQSFKISKKCLTDKLFWENTINKQKKKKQTIIISGILVTLSTIFFGWWEYSSNKRDIIVQPSSLRELYSDMISGIPSGLEYSPDEIFQASVTFSEYLCDMSLNYKNVPKSQRLEMMYSFLRGMEAEIPILSIMLNNETDRYFTELKTQYILDHCHSEYESTEW